MFIHNLLCGMIKVVAKESKAKKIMNGLSVPLPYLLTGAIYLWPQLQHTGFLPERSDYRIR